MSAAADRVRAAAAKAVGPFNKPRVYRAKHGIGRGFKQIGGIGLILPAFLRSPPEYARYAGLEEAFLRRLDLEGKMVYDVGAFVGTVTMFFARQVGDSGWVIAFEPHPRNHERILEHLRLNGLANVTVRNVAMGRTTGELRLAGPSEVSGRATADGAIQRELEASGEPVDVITVPMTLIDREIRDSALPEPDFVKIDVEGLEFDVLTGMRETIARSRPELFVEIHGHGPDGKRANARRVVQLLTDDGYAIHHVESDQPVDPSTSERALEGHIYCR